MAFNAVCLYVGIVFTLLGKVVQGCIVEFENLKMWGFENGIRCASHVLIQKAAKGGFLRGAENVTTYMNCAYTLVAFDKS